LEGEPRCVALRELGRVLARLHALPLPAFETSGLVPGDPDDGATQARLAQLLAHALETLAAYDVALAQDERLKTLQSRFGDASGVGRRAPLHSNPGPEHVFVDPSSRTLSGLIDFGDAYISHPSLDLRRWTAPEDCAALLDGYGAETEVGDAFRLALSVGHVVALVETMTRRPKRRQAAIDDVRALLSTF
jgi:Ser/Thr protein kinase RdoA (MazF antagonist)